MTSLSEITHKSDKGENADTVTYGNVSRQKNGSIKPDAIGTAIKNPETQSNGFGLIYQNRNFGNRRNRVMNEIRKVESERRKKMCKSMKKSRKCCKKEKGIVAIPYKDNLRREDALVIKGTKTHVREKDLKKKRKMKGSKYDAYG